MLLNCKEFFSSYSLVLDTVEVQEHGCDGVPVHSLLSESSFKWGWELTARVTSCCPGRCTMQGSEHGGGEELGAPGTGDRPWHNGAWDAQGHAGVRPAQWLFSAHSMRLSSLFLCPAQCVRHVQLSCLWSVWIYATSEPQLHYPHKYVTHMPYPYKREFWIDLSSSISLSLALFSHKSCSL